MRSRIQHTWLIAVRDYLELVHTRAFWIGLAVVPLLLLGLGFASAFLIDDTVTDYAVLDESGGLAHQIRIEIAESDLRRFFVSLKRTDSLENPTLQALREQLIQFEPTSAAIERLVSELAELIVHPPAPTLAGHATDTNLRFADMWRSGDRSLLDVYEPRSLTQYIELRLEHPSRELLDQLLDSKRIFGYFLIPHDMVDDGSGAKYVTRSLSNLQIEDWYSWHATRVVRARRVEQAALDPELIKHVTRSIDFKEHKHGVVDDPSAAPEAEATDVILEFLPAGFAYMLWIMIFTSAISLMTNVVEEKSNRLFEVILSSATAQDLMDGKTLAVLFSGLTMGAVWALFGAVLIALGLAVLDGETFRALANGLFQPLLMAQFLFYFVTGFLFYAALLSALGASCTTMKEAQALSLPVQLVLFVPLVLLVPVSMDPDRTIGVVLSFVPPLTPFVMMIRAIGSPVWWEYLATGGLMVATVFLTRKLCIRIYQKGVLSTGRPPRFRELAAMLKEERL